MTDISYKNLQVSTPTSGASTTLATVPTDHEYIGTVNVCYVASSGTAATTFNLAITTGGSATTENYIAYGAELEVGDSLNYTVTLDEGKVLDIASEVGNVAANFNFQDRDNT